MNDLISRQALCEYALNQKDKSITPNEIMRFPSAEPVRHLKKEGRKERGVATRDTAERKTASRENERSANNDKTD